MRKKWIFTVSALALVCAMALNFAGCASSAQSRDLMDGIRKGTVATRTADETFCQSQMRLAVELFQSSVTESEDQNVLISPLSIQLALAMTANGAAGKTRSEMEALLGGELSLEALNEYLYTYVAGLPSDSQYKFRIANSIWFRDDEERLQVEPDFLQRNADYYGAQIYKSAFDPHTLEQINQWVDAHTDGMIDKLLDEIDENAVMYLINALAFDAQWEQAYSKEAVREGVFTNITGEKTAVDKMHSCEDLYLEDAQATGFIKGYKGGKYNFVALLPKEGVDIRDYIAGLTGEGLLNILNSAQSGQVIAAMPKFSYSYTLEMQNLLAKLGMPTAFDSAAADFSQMAHSSDGNIYIARVLHKTFIAVGELGTKAGAATVVEMNDGGIPATIWTVDLDRPFVYMIVDSDTNLPVFVGAVMELPGESNGGK